MKHASVAANLIAATDVFADFLADSNWVYNGGGYSGVEIKNRYITYIDGF